MKCNIVKSPYFGQFCNKRNCPLHPCTQLTSNPKQRLRDVAILKEASR